MLTRRELTLSCAGALAAFAAENKSGNSNRAAIKNRVAIKTTPNGGIQPKLAVDEKGTLHLLYFSGDAHGGDLSYVRSSDLGASFSAPLRVNSQNRSAIAAGTIRGGQIALGRAGRVHVAWNGSMEAEPKGTINPDSGKPGMPMLYARLNEAGDAFEPQRNLMLHSFGLDGGGSIAADRNGNVYVAWHGIGESEASGSGKEGEVRRRVWITKSVDDGRTFSREGKAWGEATGACGCCGMAIYADRSGNISALYRSATESVHRDIYLLASKDKGKTFEGALLHKWNINACPMSSMDFSENEKMLVAAWETGGQIYWARLERGTSRASDPAAAPGEGKNRKHPRLALNRNGEMLLVWTEGTSWQKGGGLAWQLYDSAGKALAEGREPGAIPAWSFAAPFAKPDGTFSVFA